MKENKKKEPENSAIADKPRVASVQRNFDYVTVKLSLTGPTSNTVVVVSHEPLPIVCTSTQAMCDVFSSV